MVSLSSPKVLRAGIDPSVGRSASFEVRVKVVVIVVDFHPNGAMHIDVTECDGYTGAYRPVTTRPADVNIAVHVVIHVVVAKVNVPRAAVRHHGMMSAIVIVMMHHVTHFVPVRMMVFVFVLVAMMSSRMTTAVVVLPVILAIDLVMSSLVALVMTPSLRVCTCCYADDKQCHH